jgi:hypothetical protein
MAMKVSIKQFDVEMDVKNSGIEFAVYEDDKQLGDLILSKAKLIWCDGRTRRENGVSIKWADFIEWANGQK